MNPLNYGKFGAAVVATILVALSAQMVAGHVSLSGWINVAIAALGAISVAVIPNVANAGIASYAKYGVAAATAGLIALLSAVSDGQVTSAELIQIILAGLGALGVFAIPNADGMLVLGKTG